MSHRKKKTKALKMPKFKIERDYKLVTPETVRRTMRSCPDCIKQSLQDSDNDTLSIIEIEKSFVDGKLTCTDVHVVPYMERLSDIGQ
jgi:hypothetical protein